MNIKLTPEIIAALDKLSATNDLSINNIHYAKAVKKEWIKVKENGSSK